MTRPNFPEFPPHELPQDRALRLGAERLQSRIAELPLRYAPFVGRLASLWQTPEERVQSELSRAQDSKLWSATLLPGLRTFEIDVGATRAGERARLLRFEPGARFPKHQHRGTERVLVLEGAYTDGSCEVHAGEEQTMNEHGEHELHIIGSSLCVTAICERGIDFTGPLMRWVNPFMR